MSTPPAPETPRRPAPRRLSRALGIALVAAAAAAPAPAAHVLRTLSEDFVPTGLVADFSNYSASPDGHWVVFDACDDTTCWLASARREAVPGTAPIELAGPLFGTSNVDYRIAGDSRRVVYSTRSASGAPRELWSVPIDGSAAPVRLHPALAAGENVRDFALTEDGSQAVFAVDDGGVSGWLKTAPTDGGGAVATLDTGEVEELLLFPTASGNPRVLYLIDDDGDGLLEISTAYLASSLPFRLWAGELHADFDLDDWQITPDGSRVVLLGDVFTAGVHELSSIRTDSQNSFTRLNQNLVSGGEVQKFRLGPGNRVVYQGDPLVNNQHEIWSVPADRSSAPVLLSTGIVSGGDAFNPQVAGSWVVYLADAAVAGKTELWSAPIDGGAAPTRRSEAAPAGRSVENFEISASRTRVVYRANFEAAEREDLYSTTVSGLTAHVRLTNLNPFALFFYDVGSGFDISPDGRHVVFAVRPDAHFDGAVREQDFADPQVNPELLATALGIDSEFLSPHYAGAYGVLFRAALLPGDRVELQLADAGLFADGFDSGDRSAWSGGTP